MKHPIDDERLLRLQAWVDGELGPAEARRAESEASADADALALTENLRRFSGLLRDNPPVRAVPEPRDFYWSKIRQGIEKAEAAEAARSRPAPLRWLAWLVPAGAAALAALLLVRPPTEPMGLSQLPKAAIVDHEVETPSQDLSSLTFYASKEGMTVVWLGKIDLL